MSFFRKLSSPRGWSALGRWIIFGTIGCVLLSMLFNAWLFADLGIEARGRAMLSAALTPMLLIIPLFIHTGLRLRGLSQANHRLGLVARTDSLTAVLNRGAFTAKVSTLVEEHHAAAGALLMIDADRFKAINDLYGHASGDEALTLIARAIRNVLRNGDLVGRMGGEEFAVYLPNAGDDTARLIAERIRHAITTIAFTPNGQRHGLSVSIGGVVFKGTASFAELFRVADQRLYGAKNSGRNAVAIVHAEDHPDLALRQSA